MPTTSSDQRKLSVVLFEGFELLDVFGPVQLFGSLPDVAIEYVGPHTGPVISSTGARVVADLAYEDLARPDILMVPGGQGTRTLVDDAGFLAWLGQASSRADLVASVCTGSALLAAAGLLDGYSATSNKRAFSWASGFGDDVDWRPRARWVHDRDRWTSSGVAAGMDMATGMIADLYDADTARAVTQRAEYEPHTDSTRDPFADVYRLG